MTNPRVRARSIATSAEYEPGSFRDRESRVFTRDGDVLRALSGRASAQVDELLSSAFFREEVARGRIVATERVLTPPPPHEPEGWAAVLRHERIAFVSYPYEWTFGMLRDAALLQLDLHLRALEAGFTLKDATPFNVQFRGADPVFIDVGSFERATPGEPWAGYRQFCQTYLYPLLLSAYRGVPHQPLLRGALEGIAPKDFVRLLSVRDLLRPGVLAHGVLLARLSARYAESRGDVRGALRDAGFGDEIVRRNLRGLRRLVERLAWRERRTEWSHYEEESCPYSPEDRATREAFVRGAVAACRPGLVWDVGCNTGALSRLAAEQGAIVVALDSDPLAVERLYRSLRGERGGRVLPLVAGAGDTHTALGWRGAERRSLAERGRPDLLLALAVVHHLAITGNLPVSEIVAWLADLAREAVVEFVDPEDAMAERLLQNRPDRFPDYRRDNFERCLGRAFEVLARAEVRGGKRTLYHLRRAA